MANLTVQPYDIHTHISYDSTPARSHPYQHDYMVSVIIAIKKDATITQDSYPGSDPLQVTFNVDPVGSSSEVVLRSFLFRVDASNLSQGSSSGEPAESFTVDLNWTGTDSGSKSKTYTLAGAGPELIK